MAEYLPDESSNIRIVETKDGFISKWKVYITGDQRGAFYEVYQDADTEGISYWNPDKDEIVTVLMPLSGHYGTIAEIISNDMVKRGFGGCIINKPPWED